MPKLKVKPLTPDERQRYMQTFLESQGQTVAGLAHRQYETDGRGAIVVDVHGNPRVLNHKFDVLWLSDHEAKKPGSIGWPDDHTAGMVQRYDPDRQFVAVFRFGLGAQASAVIARIVDPTLN